MQKPLSFYGQINYTKLKEAMKSGKIVGQKVQTKDGEQLFININVWVNEEADQYNNNASIQCQLNKEAYEAKEKNTYYIGNLRYQTPSTKDATTEDIAKATEDDDDGLPF